MKFTKRLKRSLVWFLLAAIAIYGLGRLYYRLTGGFTLSNITYNLAYNSKWDIALDPQQHEQLGKEILNQNYRYLGKGCQSYVFESEDGKYVLKFFKYQRFRPQAWLDAFTFIPAVEEYKARKVIQKKQKLDSVLASWKVAYEDLKPESGVLYIHLNKSNNLNISLTIFDKIGLKHVLNLDDFEFMIQKKADLLCPSIERLMVQGDSIEAKRLLDRLLALIFSEYQRGFADNDHALMQNTGVINGYPVHIDVGQFVKNDRVKNPNVYHQEIFNKTWKFRKWLEEKYPELAGHLVIRLKELMGEETFKLMKPKLNKAAVGVISHQDK